MYYIIIIKIIIFLPLLFKQTFFVLLFFLAFGNSLVQSVKSDSASFSSLPFLQPACLSVCLTMKNQVYPRLVFKVIFPSNDIYFLWGGCVQSTNDCVFFLLFLPSSLVLKVLLIVLWNNLVSKLTSNVCRNAYFLYTTFCSWQWESSVTVRFTFLLCFLRT